MSKPIFAWKNDLRASIVVFLVALPLAMGIAIASGYPPVAGLITSIIGGIVVGALSGAPLQVSGAAAGLAVLVYDGVQRFGLPAMATVLVLAGTMQLLAGAVGLGRLFQAVSPTVLQAMLAGIGALIIASQLHVMVDAAPLGSGIDNLAALPGALSSAVLGGAPAAALALGLLTIVLMVVWPKIARGPLTLLPAPLVSVALATGVAVAFGLSVKTVAIPVDLFSTWAPTLPDLGLVRETPALLAAALQLALIASAESLLCAGALDRMHSGPRTRYDRELAAQGIGNALCGLAGGLPMTGVIVRSSANLHAGATSRLSTILHGVWALLIVGVFPELLNLIPTSALAGLLVYTGAKLLAPSAVVDLARRDKGELAVFLPTFAVVVAFDLLLGVSIGLALAAGKLLLELSKLTVSTVSEPEGGRIVVSLEGTATFVKLPTLARALERVPHRTTVIVRAEGLRLMDRACTDHFDAWRRRHEVSGGRVEVFDRGARAVAQS